MLRFAVPLLYLQIQVVSFLFQALLQGFGVLCSTQISSGEEAHSGRGEAVNFPARRNSCLSQSGEGV